MMDETKIKANEIKVIKSPTLSHINIEVIQNNWSPERGKELHNIIEALLEDNLDTTAFFLEDELNCEIYSEYPIPEGKIDTLVKKGEGSLIIDYKTHNMENWTIKDAQKHGELHSLQVNTYLNSKSPDIPKYRTGYIILCNQGSENEQILTEYMKTVLDKNVLVEICESGEPEEVVDIVRDLIKKHLG